MGLDPPQRPSATRQDADEFRLPAAGGTAVEGGWMEPQRRHAARLRRRATRRDHPGAGAWRRNGRGTRGERLARGWVMSDAWAAAAAEWGTRSTVIAAGVADR